MAPGHIPAWKRLGLKLKNAAEVPTHSDTAGGQIDTAPKVFTGNQSKRTENGLEEGHETAIRPAKKIKFNDGEARQMQNEPDSTSMIYQTPSKPREKRKSVSFTPDTKLQDGGKTADQFAHIPLSDETASSKSPTASGKAREELASSVEAASSQEKSPKKKKKKKKKKSKSTLLSSQSPAEVREASDPESHETETSTNIPSHLEYLNQYYQSRSTWKFKKAIQNRILKDLLNLNKIPHEYDAALREYIMGLSGESALTRAYESAKAQIEADEKRLVRESQDEQSTNMNGSTGKASKKRDRSESPVMESSSDAYNRARYLEALARVKKQIHDAELVREEEERIKDPAWLKRYYRRRRAEFVYWATNNKKIDPQPAPRMIKIREERPGNVSTANGVRGSATNGLKPNGVAKGETNGTESTRPKKRRRGRKSRYHPDDDTSSSESSSSDSSSDESDKGLRLAEAKLVKALTGDKTAAIPNQGAGKLQQSANGKDDENSTSSDESDTDESSDSSD